MTKFNHYLFEQIDTWFFREARSMDSSGANTLSSLFPPPTKTLLGAIRSQIGNRYHADKENNSSWKNFKEGKGLAKIIGYGESYKGTAFQAQGPWLFFKQQIYFPAPACLLKKAKDNPNDEGKYGFFSLDKDSLKPIKSDMGDYAFVSCAPGDKPLENYYLSRDGWSKVLNGDLPNKEELLSQEAIIANEPRLGIALQDKTVQQSMLYTTEHIRLKAENNPSVSVYLGVDIGSDNKKYLPDSKLIRLGGEVRMAEMKKIDNTEVQDNFALPKANKLSIDTEQSSVILLVYLLTPLPVSALTEIVIDDHKQLKINETTVSIKTAIIGKCLRFGGWDILKHQPSPLRSYLPPGSCWYIGCDKEIAEKLLTQQGSYLTKDCDKAQGYGQIVIGKLPTKESTHID